MILPSWLCSFDNSEIVLSESRSGRTSDEYFHGLTGSIVLNRWGTNIAKSEDSRFVSTSRTPFKDGYRLYEHLINTYGYYDDDNEGEG